MSGPRTSLALLSIALAVPATGCREEAKEPPVDPRAIAIAADTLAVRTGPVGEGKWRRDASYVLVEAKNTSDEDLLVTLGGALTGPELGAGAPLVRESIRIPAGGSRLFALVDHEQAVRAGATGARVELAGAVRARYAPPFTVTRGAVVLDQDRAVVAGDVRNTADRPGRAVVIGAFFDAEGRPLERASTLFKLAAGGTRGVRLAGPPGSRSAYLFIGEVEY